MKANAKALTVPALNRMCHATLILSCVLLSACRQEQIDAALVVTEILIGGSGNNTGYGSGSNSCQYAFDGACDEPTYCAYGTDTTDCSGGSSSGYGSGNDSCQYAFDGACDEPTYCAYGTDTTDCSGSSSSGYSEEIDDPGWSEVPDAFPCVSVDLSVSGGTQFIVNNCNHKVKVAWCFTDMPGHYAQCDPGPPGLGFMDDLDHYMVTSPDFYFTWFTLSPKPDGDRVYGSDHSSIIELGSIQYIACGSEHLEGAELYEMEWDAYTGRFRCMVKFPPEEPYTPPEPAVE